MTWQELLELSRRVSESAGDENLQGLVVEGAYTVFDLIELAARSEGLTYTDASQENIHIQSEEWERVFRLVLDELKAEAGLAEWLNGRRGPQDFYVDNPFCKGQAAMMLAGSSMIDLLASTAAPGGTNALNFGIVTAPVSERNRTGSAYYDFTDIFTIAKDADNHAAAQELIRFVAGVEWAQVHGKTSHELLTHTKGRSGDPALEPFYSLPPVSVQPRNLPDKLRSGVRDIVNREAERWLQQPQQPIAEWLEALQDKLQLQLDTQQAAD